ncbi:LysE family translocator, partial [Streptomyces niveiscabiei]|uniref:LysE family translocator n=1 Tax=Streptomyces niveiscabiei TaxID=164115 RepID=UPI0038F5EB4D
MLLAIKNSANFGVWQSMKGIAGNVAAVMTLASLSAAGLGAIILASDLLFSLIKVLGGLYLMYLGVKAWNTRYTKPALQKDSKPLT